MFRVKGFVDGKERPSSAEDEGLFYSTLKTWSLGPGQSSMALPVQLRTVLEYWSVGVLEYWKKVCLLFVLNPITPLLHYSSRFELKMKWLEVLTIEFITLPRGCEHESCCS
jgi:hypothetical protein